LADLRSVLAERDFRRLFSVRLISQAGDGIVTAGVGTYVFFNASSFPSPSAAAAAFTVLYLPYSLIGPFAGVLIDRWSRRQILVLSALLRSAFVVLTAAVMAAGDRGVPLYVAVLLVLGVNRFFLASLSAALPHVVAGDKLVMANSVAPTVGGIVGAIGGIIALGLNAATGDTERGAAITLLVAGCCYVAASAVAATMRRDLLGPEFAPGAEPGRLLGEVGAVATDLAAAGQRTRRHRCGQIPVRDPDRGVDPAVPELLLPLQRPGGRGPCGGAGHGLRGGLRLRRAGRAARHPVAVQAGRHRAAARGRGGGDRGAG
jgi:MFS family permease